MSNIIILIVLVVMISSAVLYIWRNKKRGIKCIGCPMVASCSKCNCNNK